MPQTLIEYICEQEKSQTKKKEPIVSFCLFSQSYKYHASALNEHFVPHSNTSQDNNGYLAILKRNRMGNQLFQYASAYGIAKHNRRVLVSLPNFEISNYFDLEIQYFNASWKWPLLVDQHHCRFDENIYELRGKRSTKYVQLLGYFQSWWYFEDVVSDIKRIFTFRPHIMERVNRFYRNITAHKNARNTFIGVHVRRGDMKNSSLVKYGFQSGDAYYIQRAMNYFINKLRNIVFVICSDEISWCKRSIIPPLDKYNRTIEVHYCDASDAPIVHLGILAACNHSIITGGSFGWWSAFLAGGDTVYFKGFPRPNSKYAQHQFSEERLDYYLSNWIGIY